MEFLLFVLCVVILLAPLITNIMGTCPLGSVMGSCPGTEDRLLQAPSKPTRYPQQLRVPSTSMSELDSNIATSRIDGRVARDFSGRVGVLLESNPERSLNVLRNWMHDRHS